MGSSRLHYGLTSVLHAFLAICFVGTISRLENPLDAPFFRSSTPTSISPDEHVPVYEPAHTRHLLGHTVTQTPTHSPTMTASPTSSSKPTFYPTVSPTPIPTINGTITEPSTDAFVESMIMLGVILMVIGFGKCLVDMAQDQMVQQVESVQPDPFRDIEKGQYWNWDMVMVFPVLREGEESKLKDVPSMKEVLYRISKATTAPRPDDPEAQGGSMQTKCFYSKDCSKVFVKIRADKERLRAEADRSDYKFRLDEAEIRERLAEGSRDADGTWRWFPREISAKIQNLMEDEEWTDANYIKGVPTEHGQEDKHDHIIIREETSDINTPEYEKKIVGKIYPIKDVMDQNPEYPYYRNIYGMCIDKPAYDSLYFKQPTTGSPFRGVDRLKLIKQILEANVSENGCGLDLSKFRDPVTGNSLVFPLHDEDEMFAFERQFMQFGVMPWQMDPTRLKDYLGEKIGLYFRFTIKYTTWLFYAMWIGVIAYIPWGKFFGSGGEAIGAYSNPNAWLVVPFCILMGIWATGFLESWKAEQALSSMQWGMDGFEDAETSRPAFTANLDNIKINSPIKGDEDLYFPDDERTARVRVSNLIIMGWCLLIIVSVNIIFIFKSVATSEEFAARTTIGPFGPVPAIPLGGIGPSILTALLIPFLKNQFGSTARTRSDRENWRTDTEYEDAFISKVFIFDFVNSYFALIYIAFIKHYVMYDIVFNKLADGNPDSLFSNVDCPAAKGGCMGELQAQLFSIFVVKILVANLKEVWKPSLAWYLSKSKKEPNYEDEAEFAEFENPEDPVGAKKRLESLVEIEYEKDEYHIMFGNMENYSEMIVQFGFATLFTAAFPMAPAMSFANNFIEIRLDVYSICQCSRRPEPSGAEDIGTWYSILETMGAIAVLTNSAIVAFTGEFLEGFNFSHRFIFFLVLEHGLFIFKSVLGAIMPDIPDDVQMQLERQDFIRSKLLKDEPDDTDPEGSDNIFDLPETKIMRNDDSVRLKSHVAEDQKCETRRRQKRILEIGEPEEKSAQL